MQKSFKTPVPRQSGAISLSLVISVVAVLTILIAVYFFFMRSSPEQNTGLDVLPTTAEERGDSARETIAELKQDNATSDLETAYLKAKEHREAGQLADAQLLYFFAAKGGHAPAAFDLATMYDPAYFNSETSVMKKADPFQAFKWYKQARDSGHVQAGARITQLKTWATTAARDGDADAERLIISMGAN